MWRASFPSAIKNRNSMILVIRFNDPGRFELSVWQVLLDFFIVVTAAKQMERDETGDSD